jgi:hypothetical protein
MMSLLLGVAWLVAKLHGNWRNAAYTSCFMK